VGSVLVLHGPNLNLLGEREQNIYGRVTLDEINSVLHHQGEILEIEVVTRQSNHEGELLDQIHSARGRFDVIIINPGALTHYSYALHDAIRAVDIPVIEVHLTNIYAREPWRSRSVVAPVAAGQIAGLGPLGYTLALQAAAELISGKAETDDEDLS
jgi:3-dehydroquinate dehydratase-2